ncbi:MAG: hypothetical protein ACPGVD_11445 [Flavobacteriales bacterium]
MRNCSEIILSEIANENHFKVLVGRIKLELEGKVISEIRGIDSIYVDFEINGNKVTLHHETFEGITVFPTDLEFSTKEENELIITIGQELKDA